MGCCSKKSIIIITIVLILVGVIVTLAVVFTRKSEEDRAREYITDLDQRNALSSNRNVKAAWDYNTNITEYNEQQMTQTILELAEETKANYEKTIEYDWQQFEDEDLKRMFQKYTQLGTAALSQESNQRLLNAVNTMQSNYATATVCDFNNTRCNLYLDPDLTEILATSENPEELKHAWMEWHRVAGAPMRGNFTEYVLMINEAARLNGFNSTAEWWLSEYEAADIEEQFAAIWNQIKPLYQQIHAYVRRHLRLKYGDNVVPARGPIPAHLLGNMWSQTWNNVERFTRPFADKPNMDITPALISQNYTVRKMFEAADDFCKSLGMFGVNDLFWERSMLENPNDGRQVVCHASAWDFYDGEDFRIKQCTSITSAYFTTTHHEMGHIQYFMQYKDQPSIYRAGANGGFHEAVADIFALSVWTPKHLRLIGLLEDGVDDEESTINQLFSMGLDKIVFLPYGYLIDLFRYSVFRGTTSPDDYNCHFWKLREEVQGIEPPEARSEQDFDPAAKYHVSANVEYMRYYVSFIIQFQFHRSLCLIANQYTPGSPTEILANCDIYNSTLAGEALAKMLQMGASKPWPDAMEALTGQRNMDASGLLEYFEPLYEWLQAENERTGEYVGWEPSTVQYCTAEQNSAMRNSEFQQRLNKYLSA